MIGRDMPNLNVSRIVRSPENTDLIRVKHRHTFGIGDVGNCATVRPTDNVTWRHARRMTRPLPRRGNATLECSLERLSIHEPRDSRALHWSQWINIFLGVWLVEGRVVYSWKRCIWFYNFKNWMEVKGSSYSINGPTVVCGGVINVFLPNN